MLSDQRIRGRRVLAEGSVHDRDSAAAFSAIPLEGGQRDLASRIEPSEEWVLDTAYGYWRDVVLPQTELIVALDYPRLMSLARLLRRALRRVVTPELACNGNREPL